MEGISVPLELQVVLREFTKTVLREKPQDILVFSRDYFVEKCTQLRMCKLIASNETVETLLMPVRSHRSIIRTSS